MIKLVNKNYSYTRLLKVFIILVSITAFSSCEDNTLPDTGDLVDLTPPTALDNCDGIITAFATSRTSFSNEGTYVVTWIFQDFSQNISTAKQKVTISNNSIVDIIIVGFLKSSKLKSEGTKSENTFINQPERNKDNIAEMITNRKVSPIN